MSSQSERQLHPVADSGCRRRLAENVVCLYIEDRPAVLNKRWRGRLPKNVIRGSNFGRYLLPGDEAEVFDFGKNHGKRVRIVEYATVSDRKRLNIKGHRFCWFFVEVVRGEFTFEDREPCKSAITAAKYLRRFGRDGADQPSDSPPEAA